jgi:hypothetical protein
MMRIDNVLWSLLFSIENVNECEARMIYRLTEKIISVINPEKSDRRRIKTCAYHKWEIAINGFA